MVTADQFRALALAMPDAVEGAHMGHPDFRANGRIFATLDADGERGMVKLTPPQQREALRDAAFAPANGAWGRQGCTMVALTDAHRTTVEARILEAWQNAMAQPTARTKTASKPRARRPRG